MVFEILVKTKNLDFREACQLKMFAALKLPSKNQHPPKPYSDRDLHTQAKMGEDQVLSVDLKRLYLEVQVIKNHNKDIINTNRMKQKPAF